MASDPRFLADGGREVFGGNELLVKGCLETPGGVGLMTGYPGSPVAGFFDTLGDLAGVLQDKGIRAFQANNEALSVAAVNGSQMMPIRAVATFKSVGVHVAADALAPRQHGRRPPRRRRGHHLRRGPVVRLHAGAPPTAGSSANTCGCPSSSRAGRRS